MIMNKMMNQLINKINKKKNKKMKLLIITLLRRKYKNQKK